MNTHFSRQLEPAVHRPETRRLVSLANTELAQLFTMRANALSEALKGHEFWNSKFIVYWSQFDKLQEELYEVMLEVQSRYPVEEHFCALPVMEPIPLK